MRTTVPSLILALGAFAILLGGCQSGNRGGANCCVSWDFYKPCDLVEGRATRDCCGQTVVTTCGPVPCGPGIVLTRTLAVPAQSAPVGGTVILEDAPAPEPVAPPAEGE